MRVKAGQEARVQGRLDAWINGACPGRDGFGFGLALGPGDRVQLPVRIRNTNGIPVDERQVADAGAGEGLRGPRAHAAQAHDDEAATRQLLQAGQPVEAADASEAFEVGGIHAGPSKAETRTYPRNKTLRA